MKNWGFDLARRRKTKNPIPVFSRDATGLWPLSPRVSRPCRFGKTCQNTYVPSVFHQWAREAELQPIVWQVTHVCLSVGASVTRRYAATLGILCHSALAHCMASHACMFECMLVTCHRAQECQGEDLRRRLAARTCGEDLRRRFAASKSGENLRRNNLAKNCATKLPKIFGEELRKQICKNLGGEVAKNGRKHFRSQNFKTKIPHPKIPASPDGPFCIAEPPKKPDPVRGT